MKVKKLPPKRDKTISCTYRLTESAVGYIDYLKKEAKLATSTEAIEWIIRDHAEHNSYKIAPRS